MQRVGLVIDISDDLPRRDLVALGRRADELGYDSFWVPEAWGRDAFSLLTEVAVLTRRIHVGTAIVTVWARTPGNTAQAIASLDEVSEGRARLGLGITGPIVAEDWHGVKWAKPFRRTREYAEIVRLAIAGERVNYDGEIFHLKNFKLQFKPPRQRIPIYVGAFGPKNVRAVAAYADGWLATEESPQYFSSLMQGLVDGATAAGRQRADLDVSYCAPAVIVAEDEATIVEMREKIRRIIAYRVAGLGDFHAQASERQGFGEQVRTIRERWSAGDRGAATALVPDAMIDALTIIGPAAHARQRLSEYRQRGADEVCVAFPPGIDMAVRMRTLEALAPVG